MRALLKAPLAVSVIAWHLFSTWLASFFLRDPEARRRHFIDRVATHARWLTKILGIDLVVEGSANARPGQNYFIVGNHMGYLDGVILPVLRRCAFVTSMEMRAVPVLGLITELGGCLYVERRSKENIHQEIVGIEEALRNGIDVVVFPEATSTNGEKVLPFKRPLFLAAAKAKVPVLPIVIQYEEIDGEAVTRANRDLLCWYGSMGFGAHFLALTALGKIRIRVKILPEIPVTSDSTRDTLMEESFARITNAYQTIK